MLVLEELSLQRGGRWLFRQVSLAIHPGWKVGLTGPNGSGKTSLLAVLGHTIETDSGNLRHPPSWRIATSDQEIAGLAIRAIDYVLEGDAELSALLKRVAAAEHSDNHDALPALHGELDAIDGYTARSRAEKVLQGLGFTAHERGQPVSSFSGGWRVRLNLARTLLARADLLLLDEPTNHLDLDAVCWLENWLRDYPGTVIVVSHDRDFLDAHTTHIANIEHFSIQLYAGNYSRFEQRRAERLLHQTRLHERQTREAARLHRFVERFRAKATKARQAQSRLKQLERMEMVEPAHSAAPFRFAFSTVGRGPDPAIVLEKARVSYGASTVLRSASLTLRPADRVGLLGRNGAGKTTLMCALAGLQHIAEGQRQTGRELRIGYFAQHQLDHLDLAASPVQHMLRRWPQMEESAARSHLGGFGFSGDRALEAVGPFSGGEKARLALALLVYEGPGLLLLDEPTNHLDLEMRHALTVALQEYGGGLVLVSHDRFLLRACCDRFLLVADGELKAFDGDLDDYQSWLSVTSSGVDENSSGAPSGESDARPSRRLARQQAAEGRRRAAEIRKPMEQEIRQLESHMDRVRSECTALDSTLADSSTYEDGQADLLAQTTRRRGELGAEMEELEARWLAVSEALERVESST